MFIVRKKHFGVAYWGFIEYDYLVNKRREKTGLVVRLRVLKPRKRQWNIEFKKIC